MNKNQKIKLLKICGAMFAALCMVIITIALLDPNLKSLLNNSTVYVSSTESDDESSANSETNSNHDISSVQSNRNDNSNTNSSKNDYADLILQKPNKYNGDELCVECHGSGLMTCPSCNGAGTEGGTHCMVCYGNGKLPCELCK